MTRIVTPEETERIIYAVAAAGLSGEPMVPPEAGGDALMCREDIMAAIEKFKEHVFTRFEEFSERVTDDFEQREAIRAHLDQRLMDMFSSAGSLQSG